jgi:hypothetical protein
MTTIFCCTSTTDRSKPSATYAATLAVRSDFTKRKTANCLTLAQLEILVRGRVLPVAPGFAPAAIRLENYRRLHLYIDLLG